MQTPILIITYYWPPGSSSGVQRWLKFVKYLPELGWKPIILTVKNGSFPAEDPSLLEEVPESVITYRSRTIEPFTVYNWLRGKTGKQVEVGMGNIKGKPGLLSRIANYIRANYFIPDARKGWNFFTAYKMKEVIRKHDIKVVVTTGPPHSTHLLGIKLKKSMPHIRWLADFRDPWSTIYYNQFLNRTKKADQKDRALETKVLETADRITVVSEGMCREFKDRTQNISIVYNGYDPEDMPDNVSVPSNIFIISFIGNFQHSQNIKVFWKALSRLVNEHKYGSSVELHITGNITPSIQNALAEFDLMPLTKTRPFVPHREATKLMKKCHLLYLPIPDTSNNKGMITGKIFEYLASRTPILSVGPIDGDAARILERCEREPMIDYHEEQALFNRLSEHLDFWGKQDGQKKPISSDAHLALTRQAQAHKISELLKELITEV